LFEDENEFAPMIPIFALAYEHHPEKEMRPYKKPISKKLRENLIAGAAAAVKTLYERRLRALRARRSDAMIPAIAAPARNTRNAVEQSR